MTFTYQTTFDTGKSKIGRYVRLLLTLFSCFFDFEALFCCGNWGCCFDAIFISHVKLVDNRNFIRLARARAQHSNSSFEQIRISQFPKHSTDTRLESAQRRIPKMSSEEESDYDEHENIKAMNKKVVCITLLNFVAESFLVIFSKF